MDPGEAPRRGFLWPGMLRMGTLSLLLVLWVAHTLMALTFRCPEQRIMALVYTVMFLFLPLIALFTLGLLLRTRRSPGLVGPECYSPTYLLYLALRAGRAPLLWILISLIDTRYLNCLALTIRDHWQIRYNFVPATQITGLILLVFFLVLDYGVPQFSWVKEQLSSLYPHREEDLALQEVEVVLQEKIAEKRKAFIQHLMRDVTLKPEDCLKEAAWDVVWKYKDMVQKNNEERNNLEAKSSGSAGSPDPPAGTAGNLDPPAGTAGSQEKKASSEDGQELRTSLETMEYGSEAE